MAGRNRDMDEEMQLLGRIIRRGDTVEAGSERHRQLLEDGWEEVDGEGRFGAILYAPQRNLSDLVAMLNPDASGRLARPVEVVPSWMMDEHRRRGAAAPQDPPARAE